MASRGTKRASRALCIALITPAYLLWGSDEPQEVFILQDVKQGSWCAFVHEEEWKNAAQRQPSDFVAVIRRVGGVLTTIYISSNSEDTHTNDEYSVDPNGNLVSLTRLTDDLTDKMTREQKWTIRGAQTSPPSETWTEFTTHRRIQPPAEQVDWLAKYPIILKLRDFPFSPLLYDKYPERWPAGRRCVKGDMNKLYPVRSGK
jgi:hypothetical protein